MPDRARCGTPCRPPCPCPGADPAMPSRRGSRDCAGPGCARAFELLLGDRQIALLQVADAELQVDPGRGLRTWSWGRRWRRWVTAGAAQALSARHSQCARQARVSCVHPGRARRAASARLPSRTTVRSFTRPTSWPQAGVDVIAARASHRGHHAAAQQQVAKLANRRLARTPVRACPGTG